MRGETSAVRFDAAVRKHSAIICGAAWFTRSIVRNRLRAHSSRRRGETNGSGAQELGGGKTKSRRTRREDGRRTDALEGRKDREAHLSFCTSAVRHPDDRSTLSVCAPFSTFSPQPSARAYHVASHLFTLTQYLLGRIGEPAVRSFARARSPAYFGTVFPLFRP